MTPSTIQELVASTNPSMEDYVVELYGNIYIHQCQTTKSIIAYQQDTQGRLHLIDTICNGYSVQQLSVVSDGRHFAFITYYSQPDTGSQQIGEACVYYLDTITNTMECVKTWPIHSVGELEIPQTTMILLFFSLNGKFVVFTDNNTLHIQSLYTDDTEHRINMACSVDDDEWEDLGNSQPNGFIQGSDYLLWYNPAGHLAIVDLFSNDRVESYNLSDSIKLESAHIGCWLYNDYLIHVNPKTNYADIYHINPFEYTMILAESIAIGQPTSAHCAPGPDSQSVPFSMVFKTILNSTS